MPISELDWKLRLLAGEPVEVKGLGQIKPLTLREIVRIGYDQYNTALGVVAVDVKKLDIYKMINLSEVRKILKLDEEEEVTLFDLAIILRDDSLISTFIQAISIFCKTNDVVFDSNDSLFVIDEGNYLHRDNFKEFCEVVIRQNCLSLEEEVEDEFKPSNDKAKAIIEKMKRAREKVKRAKAEKDAENGVDLTDIISAVSSKSNSVNKLNVFDLTLYQLYDEYTRLQMIDEYEFGIMAILQGAEKVELKHWSSHVNKK